MRSVILLAAQCGSVVPEPVMVPAALQIEVLTWKAQILCNRSKVDVVGLRHAGSIGRPLPAACHPGRIDRFPIGSQAGHSAVGAIPDRLRHHVAHAHRLQQIAAASITVGRRLGTARLAQLDVPTSKVELRNSGHFSRHPVPDTHLACLICARYIVCDNDDVTRLKAGLSSAETVFFVSGAVGEPAPVSTI